MKTKALFALLLLLIIPLVSSNAIETFYANSASNDYTNNATVTLHMIIEDANQMKFSCNGSSWSTYEIYATTKSFDINSGSYGCTPATGTRTVYLMAQYDDGNESDGTNSDTIVLDLTNPSITSFSPSSDISNGNGASGQEISIPVTDDFNLYTVTVSLDRGSTSVYDNNSTKCTVTGTSSTCAFTDLNVDRGGSYGYVIIVRDRAGNSITEDYNFAFTDSTPPSQPAKPGGVDINNSVYLEWAKNSENDLNKYGVYRSKTLGFDINSANFVAYADYNYYNDIGLDENTTYYYRITAFDWTGNESAQSDYNTFVTDFNTQITPTITRIDSSCTSTTWCPLSSPTFYFALANSNYSWLWTTSTTTLPADCNYYSDCNTASTAALSYISEGTSYFKVKACKPNGCGATASYTIKTDTTSPTVPASLSVTRIGYDANIKWTASTDAGSGIYYYYIYRSTNSNFYFTNGTKVGEVDKNHTSFLDTPPRGKTYYYKVAAIDTAGNRSTDYNVASVGVEIPQGGEETEITITAKTLNGENGQYYDKALDVNVMITFSKAVNDFNLYRKIDDANKEQLVTEQDNVTTYSKIITTSINYKKIVVSVTAKSNTGDINKSITLHFDNEPPTIKITNLTEGQVISGVYKITFEATDTVNVAKIEVFFMDKKAGSATRRSNEWDYNFDSTKFSGSGKIKAIVYDGSGKTATAEVSVTLDNKENDKKLATNAINAAKIKKEEAEKIITEKNLFLNGQTMEQKKTADDLFNEANTLLETDPILAKEKALLATTNYASIITEANSTKPITTTESKADFGFLGIVLLVIIILTIVAAIAYFMLQKPKESTEGLGIKQV